VQPTARENVPKELGKARSSTRDFITEVKSQYYVTANKDRRWGEGGGGASVAPTKIFSLGRERIKENVQN
jgi:hypothetical protein